MNTVDRLHDFAKRAERNYKYKPNTAQALSGAVKLFSTVMTEDELTTERFPLDKVDQFIDRIYTKYGTKYRDVSLRIYKSRINRIVNDYERYGTDANSMASWNPSSSQRKNSPKQTTHMNDKTSQHKEDEPKEPQPYTVPKKEEGESSIKVVDLHLPLVNDRTIVVYYPTDLTENEADKIGVVLKSIAALNSSK